MIEGQRCLRVGAAAKQDQADTVALAPGNKVLHHLFDRAQTVDLVAVGVGKVSGLHRLRDIDGEHQVAYRLLMLNGLFHQHRTGNGHHQQCPYQQVEHQLPVVMACPRGVWRLINGAADSIEKRHPHRAARLAVFGQVTVTQPGQGQQKQQPGVIKLPHDAAPPRVRRYRRPAGVVRRGAPAAVHPGHRPAGPVAG